MKARVKATGETIDVEKIADGVYVSTYDKDVYLEENLDFWGNAFSNLDYWTRLEHQYAGMAMQAYIIASHISQFSFCEGDMKDCKSMAHALVEKLKEKEERK